MIIMLKIKDIIDNNIYVEYNNENYVIKKEYISGTLIQNYFMYGCYGVDDYDYFIGDYTTLEDALKDLLERDI